MAYTRHVVYFFFDQNILHSSINFTNQRDFIGNVGPINNQSKLKTGKGKSIFIRANNIYFFLLI